jgi:hypothetical protein
MITAQLPFDAETPYALMLQHLQGTVRPPHELKPELHIPLALSQVILRAMEKSREQRFQTAEEFVAALDQVTASSVASEALGTAIPKPRIQAVPTPSTAALAVPVSTTGSAPTAADPEPRAAIVQSVAAPDPAVVNSAAQHVFLPPRGLTAKLLLRFVIVGLAAILVAGAGYLKFRSVRRVRISGEVMEKLKAASSSLPGADLRVSVSDDREVSLDGAVRAAEDSSLAESLASSVPGVVHVRNRLIVVPTVPTETTESLVNRGVSFLDAGDYSSAIDCFRKALADPNNKGAQELLDRAQRAQQTEEELLKNRQ